MTAAPAAAVAPAAPSEGSLSEFLDAVAAARPDPGGGAASAVVLAIGVALAQMVAGYSTALTAAEPELAGRLARARADAEAMVALDAEASAAFAASMALPQQDPERVSAVVAACLVAADSALAIAGVATRLLADLRVLDRHGEPRLHADVRVSAATTGAAIRASIANVQACLDLAQTTGATTGELLQAMRRVADLAEPLDLADALARTSR